VTLRSIHPLGDRAGRFARELRRRHTRGRSNVSQVDALLAPLHGVVVRQLVSKRYTFKVTPGIRLALATAPCRAHAAPAPATHGRRRETSTMRVEQVVRTALTERERRVIELRVADAAASTAEHVLVRAVRIEPGSSHAAKEPVLSRMPRRTLPSLPALPLVPVTRPAEPAAHEAHVAVARPSAVETSAAWISDPPRDLTFSGPTPPALDVEQITDSVLDAIDRRVVARRERQERL
jgi:hypothetical protein